MERTGKRPQGRLDSSQPARASLHGSAGSREAGKWCLETGGADWGAAGTRLDWTAPALATRSQLRLMERLYTALGHINGYILHWDYRGPASHWAGHVIVYQ